MNRHISLKANLWTWLFWCFSTCSQRVDYE